MRLHSLTPADLVLLIEELRGSLADMLRVHEDAASQWAGYWKAEEADLALMSRTELQGLAASLQATLAGLAS
ncbi:hypothetical protein ACPC54_23290 [Kitasatospora sp. NPDC094028]